jgi:hypothetical protein
METLNLNLTNVYQQLPKLNWICAVRSWYKNTWDVILAKSTNPDATKLVILWPGDSIPLNFKDNPNVILYVKSSIASGDKFYMMSN